MTETRTTCPYCGVGCGVVASVVDGAVSVRGDSEHPANVGRLCVKGSALGETTGLEGRLLHPSVDGQQVNWERALDVAGERLRAIINEHGPQAVAFYASGHEIGNHSASHNMYSSLTESEIIKDITLCNEAVKKAIGITPVLLRAPSGDYTNDTITAATKLNMKTIQWSVDSLDWKGLDTDEIVKRVTDKTECGSIILFHNDIKNTPDALDRILTGLEKKGYSFVTVSELIYDGDYKIDSAGKQIKNAAAN